MKTPSSLRATICTGVLTLFSALPLTALTTPAWRADLEMLVTHIRENHRNPYHTLSKEDFEAAVTALEADLESLSDRAIILRLARLVAAVGDGHTRLTLPVDTDHLGYRLGHIPDLGPAASIPRFGTLPVRLRLLESGLHVVATTSPYRSLLGIRVERIAEREAEAALRAVLPWVFGDTESGRRHAAAIHLGIPTLLVEAGISPSLDTTALTFRHADDRLEMVQLPTLEYGDEVSWHTLHDGSSPLWLRDRERYFWLEPLPEADALYIQVNQVQDASSSETLGRFGSRIAAAVAEHAPHKVILDLRHNHGGDASLARAIVLPLTRWTGSADYGRLYTLVGPETFSAAVNLLDRLEQWTQNILVGEEPGSGPTHYSDADREVLPNSQLVVRVSTSYFIGWTGGESRTRYEVDLPVKPSAAALHAGRDPVLETALAHQAGKDLTTRMIAAYDANGVNSALFVWFRSRTDPLTAHLSTESPTNTLAAHVLAAGEARFAANLYVFNWENYPQSVAAYRGEAEARLVLNDIPAARTAIEKALAIAPDDATSREVARRIEAREEE